MSSRNAVEPSRSASATTNGQQAASAAAIGSETSLTTGLRVRPTRPEARAQEARQQARAVSPSATAGKRREMAEDRRHVTIAEEHHGNDHPRHREAGAPCSAPRL